MKTRLRRVVGMAAVLVAAAGCTGDDDDGSSPRPGPGGPAEMPGPRTEVAGALWNGRIVVAGGLLMNGRATNRVDVYDPGDDEWSEGVPLPANLHHTALAVLDDRLYVVGGYTIDNAGTWRPQARVWSLGQGDDEWRDEPPLRGPRGALALVSVGGRLVAAGGEANGEVLTRAEAFTPGDYEWQALPPLGLAREHLAAAAAGGRVYVIAGRAGGQNFTAVESLALGEQGWRPEPALNDSRGGIAADTVGDAPCVAGGEQAAGTIASVECLRGGRWERVASLRVPRHGLAAVTVGSALHIIGGGPRPGLTVSGAHEVFRL